MPGTRKLGKTTDQRMAMLRQQVTDFLDKGRMETTITRAKEIKPMAEKMITLGKKGDLAAYRQALSYTRAMVTAALTGEIEKSEFVTDPTFGVQVPTAIEGVPSELLIPANTWEDKAAYEASCKKLAASFVENFKKYTHMPQEVVEAGPKA